LETLTGLAQALEASPFGVWARSSTYGYPAANLLHLLGLVMLVGGIGLLDLRLAGLFRRLPVAAMSRVLTPIGVTGLVLMIPSGFVMFASDAGPLLGSAMFQRKLALITLAVANALAFRVIWRRRMADWDRAAPAAGQVMAAASVAIWLMVAAFGRLIAYT
jgi:hypothetical protein